MKFYVIFFKDKPQFDLGIFSTIEDAKLQLSEEVDFGDEDYWIQEYEGWATCMRWRHGEKI